MGVCRNVCIFHANYVVLQQTVSEQCKDKEVFGVALCICLHSAFLPDDCQEPPATILFSEASSKRALFYLFFSKYYLIFYILSIFILMLMPDIQHNSASKICSRHSVRFMIFYSFKHGALATF